MSGDTSDKIAQLLAKAVDGELGARTELEGMLYKELRLLAEQRDSKGDGNTRSPASLLQQVFQKFVADPEVGSESGRLFLLIAAYSMRRIRVDDAQDGVRPFQQIPKNAVVQTDDPHEVLAIEKGLKKLEGIDSKKVEVVTLRYFGGLSEAQAATTMNVPKLTLQLEWRLARAWLHSELTGTACADATKPTSWSDSSYSGVVKTLLLTDLVESTRLTETLGDERAAKVFSQSDRVARELLQVFHGLEIDKTDGFLFMFDRPIDAVCYVLAYHDALTELSHELKIPLAARAGIHLGEVVIRKNTPKVVKRGGKAIELEGLAKLIAARIMSLAGGGQTLMTKGAFDLGRRAAVGSKKIPKDVAWMEHGPYLFKGVEEPQVVAEVGRHGRAPLEPPPDSEKVKRSTEQGDEETLGWRPAVGLAVPNRNGWILNRKLGESGFGEVWLAAHKRTREHRAFKFCFRADRLRSLKRELSLFRLMKEKLGHRPDIARLFEVQLDAAPYFLEMEYTQGGDLVGWAAQQGGIDNVPIAIRLTLMAQVAEALGAAHSVGVIHKDVKPTNVLIQEEKDGSIQARLSDFGIGQLVTPNLLAEAGITQTGFGDTTQSTDLGSPGGTPLYMAPELLAGRPATIQSDIHALGVLLYQMIVGDFSRPLARRWQDSVEDELLREDVATCIADDPTERFQSAELLAERLLSLDARRTDRAHRDGPGSIASK